jgi:DNA-binding response OmpR family regulator
MPNINGIDFLKILRRNMATREIPVIVVSALGQETQIQEGIDAGANAYFVKPFDPETLLARIDFLFGKEAVTRDS